MADPARSPVIDFWSLRENGRESCRKAPCLPVKGILDGSTGFKSALKLGCILCVWEASIHKRYKEWVLKQM